MLIHQTEQTVWVLMMIKTWMLLINPIISRDYGRQDCFILNQLLRCQENHKPANWPRCGRNVIELILKLQVRRSPSLFFIIIWAPPYSVIWASIWGVLHLLTSLNIYYCEDTVHKFCVDNSKTIFVRCFVTASKVFLIIL